MAAKKYVQCLTQYLAGSGVVIGATSIVLTSFTDIYGNAITSITSFGDKGYITLEPDTTNEEAASFTTVTANANGTVTLGGVSTVLAQSPYTETSGLVRSHSGGTKVVITDNVAFWNTFTNKNNNETIAGLWTAPSGGTGLQIATANDIASAVSGASGTATNLVFGTVKLSVAAASGPTPIAVGDNDTRVPTAGQALALAGDIGTPGSNNKYLTQSSLPTGSITMYGAAAAPTGWVLCDGSSLLRAGTYAALFAVIGTTFGTADGTHFNAPDLRGRIPMGLGTGTGGGASGTGLPTGGSALTARTIGDWHGEQTHVLTTGELAAHTHTQTITSGGTGFQSAGSSGYTLGGNTGSAGSDTAHNNLQPAMVLNFIIKI